MSGMIRLWEQSMVCENKDIHYIIKIYINHYSLCSMVVPYAQELSLLPHTVGKRNHRTIAVNNVGVCCYLEPTCRQYVTFSFDTTFFASRSLAFMAERMALKWSILSCAAVEILGTEK